MTLPFDHGEYAARLRRTRAAMRDAGLDALLVFHQEHMFYLAGYDQIGYWVYQVLIVPAADAPMTAVVRKVDELLVRDGGIVEDVRVWLDDATRDPAQQTADILAERGLLRASASASSGRATRSCPTTTISCGTARRRRAGGRVRPHHRAPPREVAGGDRPHAPGWRGDGCRGAGRLGSAASRRARVRRARRGGGGDVPRGRRAPVRRAPHGHRARTLTQTHGAATTREIHAGDPFLLEVGGCVRRYHAVCMRTASVGPPSARMRSMHDAIREATDAGLAAISLASRRRPWRASSMTGSRATATRGEASTSAMGSGSATRRRGSTACGSRRPTLTSSGGNDVPLPRWPPRARGRRLRGAR